MNNIIDLNRQNIWTAISDYRRHTCMTTVLDDVSDAFVDRLAEDSAYAKRDLRELFSRSNAWNHDLQAIVINGTKTHNPNYALVRSLAETILNTANITGKGFKKAFGSFSDISVIAPVLGVAAVNLSSGYYNPHQLDEYIVRSEVEDTIKKVVEIVADSVRADFPRYEYDTGGYYYDWWQEESVAVPADLPAEYHEIYAELSYVYTAEQLEEIRLHYGNHILWQLYCDKFGSPLSR